MKTSAYEHFMAAFQMLIAERGRGTQRRLAEYLDKSPENVNHVLKGRKEASRTLQEGIAEFFGFTYEEMQGLGRKLLEGESIGRRLPFQEELDRLPGASEERYLFIYLKICEELAIPQVYPTVQHAIETARSELQAYRSGELSDFQVYNAGRNRVARIWACTLRQFRATGRAK